MTRRGYTLPGDKRCCLRMCFGQWHASMSQIKSWDNVFRRHTWTCKSMLCVHIARQQLYYESSFGLKIPPMHALSSKQLDKLSSSLRAFLPWRPVSNNKQHAIVVKNAFEHLFSEIRDKQPETPTKVYVNQWVSCRCVGYGCLRQMTLLAYVLWPVTRLHESHEIVRYSVSMTNMNT